MECGGGCGGGGVAGGAVEGRGWEVWRGLGRGGEGGGWVLFLDQASPLVAYSRKKKSVRVGQGSEGTGSPKTLNVSCPGCPVIMTVAHSYIYKLKTTSPF